LIEFEKRRIIFLIWHENFVVRILHIDISLVVLNCVDSFCGCYRCMWLSWTLHWRSIVTSCLCSLVPHFFWVIENSCCFFNLFKYDFPFLSWISMTVFVDRTTECQFQFCVLVISFWFKIYLLWLNLSLIFLSLQNTFPSIRLHFFSHWFLLAIYSLLALTGLSIGVKIFSKTLLNSKQRVLQSTTCFETGRIQTPLSYEHKYNTQYNLTHSDIHSICFNSISKKKIHSFQEKICYQSEIDWF
jgi:hypothetical protein